MATKIYGPGDLWWLSPLAGGFCPAVYLLLREGVNLDHLLGDFTIWALRDLFQGYALVLPQLCASRRMGVKSPIALWTIAALAGGPTGYVLANPMDYAWTPTDEDFANGPFWVLMFTYMALSGLSGWAFAVTRALL